MKLIFSLLLCFSLSSCSWSWTPVFYPTPSDVCPRGKDSLTRQCRWGLFPKSPLSGAVSTLSTASGSAYSSARRPLRPSGVGAAVYHYLDLSTEMRECQTLSQEEMIGRNVILIPARHFMIVLYSRFLASRKEELCSHWCIKSCRCRREKKRTSWNSPCQERLRWHGSV